MPLFWEAVEATLRSSWDSRNNEAPRAYPESFGFRYIGWLAGILTECAKPSVFTQQFSEFKCLTLCAEQACPRTSVYPAPPRRAFYSPNGDVQARAPGFLGDFLRSPVIFCGNMEPPRPAEQASKSTPQTPPRAAFEKHMLLLRRRG